MEGILWKWTNYFTGWQPRWFVLDTGILSYYKSQDDVNNGCKGSIRMSVCDVIVHPTDSTRLDLIIPGEAHFYVKSATPQERQQWLVALGSCKACLRNGRNGKKPVVKEEMNEDSLRAKKSELRLYCDLLMQQVHSVKSAVNDQPEVKQKLNEATSLLSATCDTFIATLEDCVRLANADAPYPTTPTSPHVMDSALPPPSPLRRANSQNKTPSGRPSIQRSTSSPSDSRSSLHGGSPLSSNEIQNSGHAVSGHIKGQRSARSSISRSRTPSESSEVSTSERDVKDRMQLDQNQDLRNSLSPVRTKAEIVEESDEEEKDEIHHTPPSSPRPSSPTPEVNSNGVRIETMFSMMSVSFMDIKLGKDGGIPVEPFLDACNNVLLIFDKLSPTAFAPIKMDISGNVKKVHQKFSTNPSEFQTLQNIVAYEVNKGEHTQGNSATMSLVWLKRGMMFIREFLAEVHLGESELEDCAYNAYSRTLRHFHGFVIRGVFAVAVKAVPSRKDFIVTLLDKQEDSEKPRYVDQVLSDLDDYITAQGVLIKIIDDYLTSQGIDHKTIV